MPGNDEKIKEEPLYDLENLENFQMSSEEQKYKCRICEFECDNKEVTILHVQMDHLKDKQCDMEFSEEDYLNFLNLHIELVHEGKNPQKLQDISTSEENNISSDQFNNSETVYVEDHKQMNAKLETEEKSLSTESRNDESLFERPKMSYCQLISEALINSSNGMLVLSDIYEAISSKYPYFKITTKSWQNSIRHNLSLDKSFTKEEKIEKIIGPDIENEKRGCYWKLADPKYLMKKSKKRKKVEESQLQLNHNYNYVEQSTVDHEGKKPSYKCKICDASFKSKLCLKRHVQSVDEEKNTCDICSLGFQSKFILSQHIMSIHEGMTPLKCGFCNASFPSEKRIKRHVEQVHEKRKPFKCNLCKTGYFEKSKLKIHMNSPLHLAANDKAIEKIDEEQNCVEIKENPKDINETNTDIVFVPETDIADKINEETFKANFSEVWEENHENIDIKLEQLESTESIDDRKFDPLLDQRYEKKNETFADGLIEYMDLNCESVHERKKQDVNQCNFKTQGQIVQEEKSLDNRINAVEKVAKIQISSEDTEYKCSLCEFESDNKNATATHIQMVHEEKKHNFIPHVRSLHYNFRYFKCLQCPKEFS